eukprot:2887441-Pyramimonas_sp.AAC.1
MMDQSDAGRAGIFSRWTDRVVTCGRWRWAGSCASMAARAPPRWTCSLGTRSCCWAPATVCGRACPERRGGPSLPRAPRCRRRGRAESRRRSWGPHPAAPSSAPAK